jgi:hypothetical protein
MQLITLQNFNTQTCFTQFLWFFQLKIKGQIISRIHLSLPSAYKLMYFDRNINGNRDVECDKLLVQRCVKLTLVNRHGCFDHGGCAGCFSVVIFSCFNNLALHYNISKVLRKVG